MNIFIQVLTLAAALLLNFLIPWLYGLAVFGDFIKANAVVYTVAKLLDAFNEPFLSSLEKGEMLLASLSLNGVIFLAFALASLWFDIGSLLLLGSMLLSASVLISLFANALTKQIAAFLGILLVTFATGMMMAKFSIINLSIVSLIAITNMTPSLFGLSYLLKETKWGGVSFSRIYKVFRSVPSLLSMSLILNFWYNLSPVIFGNFLSSAEVGLMRVSMSAVQASVSVFPISTRIIIVNFKKDVENSLKYLKTLLASSFVYFTALIFGVCSVSLFWEPIRKFLPVFLLLPFFYWVVLFERFLWAQAKSRYLAILNIILSMSALAGSFFVHDIFWAFELYIGTYILYLFCLWRHVMGRESRYQLLLCFPFILACPYVAQNSIEGLWSMSLLLFVYGLIRFRISRKMLLSILGQT